MSPILGHLRRVAAPGLWAALLAASPSSVRAEVVSIPITPDTSRLVVLSALAAGAVALAIAASLWALAEQRNARQLKRNLRSTGARTRSALSERDALLGAGREALVVWGRDGSGPFSYGGGEELLDACL